MWGSEFADYNKGFLVGRNTKAKSLKAVGQGYGKKSVGESYDTSDKNREWFDGDYDEWETEVIRAGAAVVRGKDTDKAQGWDGLCGEWDHDSDKGWLVDEWSRKPVKEDKKFGSYYYEQLAKKLPLGLKTDDNILDAAFVIAKKDLGDKKAAAYFQRDEDFPGDLVSAYRWWQKNHQKILDDKANGTDEVVMHGVRYERTGPKNSVSKAGKWKLSEGTFVIKSKDGVEKRFKNADSTEALDWKETVAKKKAAPVEKYTNEWWYKRQMASDDFRGVIIPAAKIDLGVSNGDLKIEDLEKMGEQLGFANVDDYHLVRHGYMNVDGYRGVATATIRVVAVYEPEDDIGVDETTSETYTVIVRRDVKDPKKFVFVRFQ